MKNCQQGLAERRGDQAFQSGHGWNNIPVEDFDLARRLGFAFQNVGVGPPTEKADGIQVMQFPDAQAGSLGQLQNIAAAVAPMMAEVFVDGPVERPKGRNQQDNGSARGQHGGHGLERREIVLDVFQNVDDNRGIRIEFREIAEFRRKDIAFADVQVGVDGKTHFEPFDAFRLNVHGDDGIAIE